MINSIITIVKEQIDNFNLIRRLAKYEVKTANAEKKLGLIWELVNPALQIMIYWFVFGVGLRGNSEVDGVPFIVWLVAGLTPWFFINDAILRGSNSINTRLGMLVKMRFPLSVIPSYVIFSRIYQHFAMIIIVIVLTFATLHKIPLSIIQLPYYLIATIAFVYSVALLLSTLITLVKDVHPLLQSILRMLFYVTPILWSINTFPEKFHGWLMLNPIMYLVEGYRSSLVSNEFFFSSPYYTLYFWGVTLLIFAIGAKIHLKFRNSFSELV